MVGVRNDDTGRRGFPAKPVKLRSFQQNWIDNVNFSGSYDRTGTELGLYRGIVVLPDKEAENRLVEIAGDRHGGPQYGR